MRYLLVFLIFLMVAPSPVWAGRNNLEILTAKGPRGFRVEVAVTARQHEKGLMYRKELCDNCGMLFQFRGETVAQFWMKNTPLPLAIAFINSKGHILKISEMQAHSLHNYSAQGDILYALEMNAGWFSARQIKTGEQIEGLNQASVAE